ncbi:hypothetical protein BDN67DRAFT_975027 [Paxillus ammoniavirescens]|nr:hypothetical protein BDN67DRAFT_975027 [Paxillus ammoniavirescens]
MVLKSVGVRHPTLCFRSQIENPTNGYLFFTWESYEAHLRVMNHASYPDVIAILQPCQGRKIQMCHVQFSAPTIAFEKPVTEVLVSTLGAAENRATVADILSKLSEASQKMLVFGRTDEDKNKYIVQGSPLPHKVGVSSL